jgi:hypothetical protein
VSLFRSSLRPPAILSDEAVERYLSALRATVEPDPLFRRRLRTEVMNRYVAAREGHVAARAMPRRMGRLGRAVLYASFTLAVSFTSVMAASEEAIPGDVLYPLKRQVEELRAQVVPAHLQDELAAYVLAERIQELGRLTDNGSWAAAVVLAEEVSADYRAYVAAVPNHAAGAVAQYVAALNGLLDGLPAAARAAVEIGLAGMPGIDPSTNGRANANGGNAGGNGGGPVNSPPGGGGGPPDGAGNGGPANGGRPSPTPDPVVVAPPDPSPAPTPAAEPTLKPTKAPKPEPTPRPTPAPRGPDSPQSGD